MTTVEIHPPRVLNAHHFGGLDKLPDNAVYVGRPSIYGNRYSSKSGIYTKEECVALHRVDLYFKLIQNPLFFDQLKDELGGRDLVCWCKQIKRLSACHADNYLHVLDPRLIDRRYDKTVLYYLMDDLRYVSGLMDEWVRCGACHSDYLPLFIRLSDTMVGIREALRISQEKDTSPDNVCFLVAQLVIDFELAIQEVDVKMADYRLAHAEWVAYRFTEGRSDRFAEPANPSAPMKRKTTPKISSD